MAAHSLDVSGQTASVIPGVYNESKVGRGALPETAGHLGRRQDLSVRRMFVMQNNTPNAAHRFGQPESEVEGHASRIRPSDEAAFEPESEVEGHASRIRPGS